MPSPAAAGDNALALDITRTLEAPQAAVFAAFTDPVQVARWMGPGTIGVTVDQFEAKPGGAYRILMHGTPPGMDAVRGVYREVVPPSRLVFTWAWEDAATKRTGLETLVTVTLRARGDRTELSLRHERFDTPENRDAHNGGWNATIDKLEKLLSEGRK